ncbi:MAG: YciI family protein [Thermoanaerobaculia bacterium]
MPQWKSIAIALVFAASSLPAQTPPEKPQPRPGYDAALATRLGADEHGMRSYVLVILRTGPTRVPDGPERDAMFAGHFANMKRLAAEGKLIAAGPLDGVDGWRGMFVFAEEEIDAAAKLVATDPVIVRGEMVAEYHKYYGSAGLMLVPETHERVTKESF